MANETVTVTYAECKHTETQEYPAESPKLKFLRHLVSQGSRMGGTCPACRQAAKDTRRRLRKAARVLDKWAAKQIKKITETN